jgi:hypothetical protein
VEAYERLIARISQYIQVELAKGLSKRPILAPVPAGDLLTYINFKIIKKAKDIDMDCTNLQTALQGGEATLRQTQGVIDFFCWSAFTWFSIAYTSSRMTHLFASVTGQDRNPDLGLLSPLQTHTIWEHCRQETQLIIGVSLHVIARTTWQTGQEPCD